LPENKHVRRLRFVLYGALCILIIWLLLRFALPWLLPFILAFVISRLIEPAVHLFTERFHFKRGYASAFCVIVVFSALVALTAVVIGRAVIELTAFVKDLPNLLSNITNLFTMIGDRIDGFVKSAPPEIQDYLNNVLDGFSDKSAEWPAALSGKLLGVLSSVAGFTPRLVLFIFTCAVSTFFISCGYKEVVAFIMRQTPRTRHRTMQDIKNDLISTLGKWVKAELMLSGITFIELTIAFLFMRIDFAILLALLISIIDALPVLGAGTVLVPWAILTLIGGDIQHAVTIIIIFGIIMIVRNILEPKLIGKQIGLPPIATLMAIYIGFCSVGVLGMVIFPIGLIMIKHINDRGYIRLWK
jgi:sporulation integral membrane protein YtvI